MLFTSADIISFFGHHTFSKGADYMRQQRVLECRVGRAGNALVVSAEVQGSGRPVYAVHVRVARARGHVFFDNDCSCPVGVDCKHVVAALLEVLRHDHDTSGHTAAAAVVRSPVDTWLERLREPSAPELPPSARPTSQCLAYVLVITTHGLQVKPWLVRKIQKGGYGTQRKAVGYLDTDVAPYNRKEYHSDLDLRILGSLRALTPVTNGMFPLQGEAGAILLGLLLRTGHCHWDDLNAPTLTPGAPLPVKVEWEPQDGRYRLALQWPRPGLVLLPLDPPAYYDPDQHCCGRIETDLSGATLAGLHDSPALSEAEVGQHAADLTATLSRLRLPLPPQIKVTRIEGRAPEPLLRLHGVELTDRWDQRVRVPVAELAFRYGEHVLPGVPGATVHRQQSAGTLFEIVRDQAAESACHAALDDLPTVNIVAPLLQAPPHLRTADSIEDWLEFMTVQVPVLREFGWHIDMADDFEFQLLPVDDWYGTVEAGSPSDVAGGSDWFDLELGVVVGGKRLNILPLLTEALSHFSNVDLHELQHAADDARLPILTGHGVLELPMARLRPLLATLVELYDQNALDPKGRLRLSRLDSARLPDLQVPWEGSETLRALGNKLRDFHGIQAVEPPAGFGAELRPYQQAGLNWLQFLRDYGLNGVLADDMGLGKTVQTLAHLLLEKQAGRIDRPCLVVAPTSLMHNWRREAEKFTPGLRVLILHGPDRHRHFASIAQYDLVLTTYPLLARDSETLQRQKWHYLILDEAQVLKNPKAKATQQVQQLVTRHRLALTGTPMENHLGELWSLFNVLMPGLLGSHARFNNLYRQPIERDGDTERRDALARRLSPFMLRRTKTQVATELPPKTEILRSVSLEGAQRDLYESIRLSMDKKLRDEISKKGFARSRIMILDALLKLRQACCDPRLLSLESARRVQDSAKLELLMDLLPELLAEGRRVLLFSQFTTMLGLIEAELTSRDMPYVKLTGQTRDRATPVERFQNGEVPLFLISLKAGGTGLNLTAADTVIHYDPWWNPAVEQQATDRAYRIGQDKPVFVYKLITEGTVEEKILALQARKAALAQGVYGETDDEGAAFDHEDLEALFRPLE
ncbi:MAG TPA: DEAD/DEAH box helicase [Moraxellaceae bacterium]|nr:DEAD/DEAH box helicase [Moraxellaceae bacterium]